MTTQTMIERVAQAIAATDIEFPYVPFAWPSAEVREHYMRLSRAALQALREPTEEMEDAAYDLDTHGMMWPAGAKEIFTAMIEAALQEK